MTSAIEDPQPPVFLSVLDGVWFGKNTCDMVSRKHMYSTDRVLTYRSQSLWVGLLGEECRTLVVDVI